MEEEEIKTLFQKYHSGQCTPSQKALIEEWVMQLNEYPIDIPEDRIEEIGVQILHSLQGKQKEPKNFKLWTIISTVAAISAVSIITLLYVYKYKSSEQLAHTTIVPGGKKATLTLAGGKVITLSQQNQGISVNASGMITYIDGAEIPNQPKENEMATIATPNGGEYQIVLSDGTKVWLNAASTLVYPITFRERSVRNVELKGGEAYFEVAKDSKRPFVVKTDRQRVVVLGTHFNINSYKPSTIKTTLLEGSVRVENSGTNVSQILKPGQQAINRGKEIKSLTPNTDIEMAWKKGKIRFVREEFRTVMEMVSRWYDIDVVYQYYPNGEKFTGSISRHKNISEVLDLLETTGDVHFKIEGRKVLIMQ